MAASKELFTRDLISGQIHLLLIVYNLVPTKYLLEFLHNVFVICISLPWLHLWTDIHIMRIIGLDNADKSSNKYFPSFGHAAGLDSSG